MKNPIKRLARSAKKIFLKALNFKQDKKKKLSPVEIRQQKRMGFQSYYTFCMSVPSYKRKGNN